MLAVATAPEAAAYPKVTTLTPGAPIGTYTAAGTRDAACTAGWLARTSSGDPVMLTAGHCFSNGVGSQTLVGLDANAGNYTKVGEADYVVHTDTADVAVVPVAASVSLDARVLERRPVSGVVAAATPGDEVCMFGAESGRHCGTVTLIDGDSAQVWTKMQSTRGDSGAPVYKIGRSGTAQPVGILVQGNGDATIVQPIADVLRERELTLIQTETPAPHIQPVSHR